MGTLYKIGENAAVPPAGHKLQILDADGLPVLLSSDGTREDMGGGTVGAADLESALFAFAQSQYPTINRKLRSEVTALNLDWQSTVIGPNNGTATQTQAVKGGVVGLATNAAGPGGILVYRNAAVTSPISFNALTDVPWFVASVATMPATIDGNTQCAVNFETVSFSAAVEFGIVGAVSQAFYSMVIGATTRIGTVPVDLSGAYVLLMQGFDGTRVRGWVSTPAGILTAAPTLAVEETILTNVPTSQCIGLHILHQNSAVAQKTNRLDYLFEAWSGAA